MHIDLSTADYRWCGRAVPRTRPPPSWHPSLRFTSLESAMASFANAQEARLSVLLREPFPRVDWLSAVVHSPLGGFLGRILHPTFGAVPECPPFAFLGSLRPREPRDSHPPPGIGPRPAHREKPHAPPPSLPPEYSPFLPPGSSPMGIRRIFAPRSAPSVDPDRGCSIRTSPRALVREHVVLRSSADSGWRFWHA